MATGGLVVATPRPVPAPFGLVNSKTLVTETDPHWAGGFTYEDTTCTLYGTAHDVCNYAETGASAGYVPGTRTGEDDAHVKRFSPFMLEATDGCRTSFSYTVNERKARAVTALELLTQKLLERAFWSNTFDAGTDSADNRTLLGSGPTVLLSGAAVKPRRAVAALEQALANDGAGTLGAVHVTRDVLSMLKLDVGNEPNEDVMYTPGGSLLIGGVGYTGNGPGNSSRTDSRAWAIATGPVSVRLSEIESHDEPTKINGPAGEESFHTNNTLVYTASRSAAVTFNGCRTYAVLVDLDG